MGSHANITNDKFPVQSRSLGEKVILTYMGQTLLACVERRDREEPNRIIWSVRNKEGRQIFLDSLMMDLYPEINFLDYPASQYCMEFKTVNMHFHYDTSRSVKAICVYDRGPCSIFKALEGEFEDSFYNATECQYGMHDENKDPFGLRNKSRPASAEQAEGRQHRDGSSPAAAIMVSVNKIGDTQQFESEEQK